MNVFYQEIKEVRKVFPNLMTFDNDTLLSGVTSEIEQKKKDIFCCFNYRPIDFFANISMTRLGMTEHF